MSTHRATSLVQSFDDHEDVLLQRNESNAALLNFHGGVVSTGCSIDRPRPP
jgi:hypothetical protein